MPELLEVSMIASVAGEIRDGVLTAQRPFRSPIIPPAWLAMKPCRCGHAYEPGFSCKRGRVDRCTSDYQMRISAR